MRKISIPVLLLLFAAGIFAQQGKFHNELKAKEETKNSTNLRSAFELSSLNLKLLDSTVIWKEDWEGINTWTNIDETDVGAKWHLDAFNAYGGSGESWWVGDPTIGNQGGGYDNHWYQVLDTDPINLSGTTSPSFTFYHRFKVEAPGGEPAGYNGWDGMNVRISTDGGTTWSVLTNPNPNYNVTSLYSFGFEWGEGQGIPGWGGAATTWQQVTFSLTAFAGQTVNLRFAFASDPSFSTPDDPSMFGWQVDEIKVEDGANVIFYNTGIAGGLNPSNNGDIGGDLWRVATGSGLPSPTHFATANDSLTNSYLPNMINSIVSEYFYLPDTLNTAWMDFYLQGSFIDNDVFPEVDYFGAFVQKKGEAVWRYVSNITQNPSGSNYVYSDAPLVWARFSDTYSVGLVDLSPLLGDSIRIKFTFLSDEDQPLGTALQVDDIVVWTTDEPVIYSAPQNLTAVESGTAVIVQWDDLNISGSQRVIYDDNSFENAIHLNSGTADAGAYISVNNPVSLDTVWIWGATQNTATSTTLKVWAVTNGVPSTTPIYTEPINITANQWNAFDVSGAHLVYNDDFIVGYEISLPIWVGLDQTSIPSTGSYVNLGVWSTWKDVALANSLPDGEWGIRASITYTGGTVITYDLYRKQLTDPSFTSALAVDLAEAFYIDTTTVAFAGYSLCYAVKAVYGTLGESNFSNQDCIIVVSVEEEKVVPKVFNLEQNYPNPFNPSTSIRFALPVDAKVTVKLYDILGRELVELANNSFNAGIHTLNLNAVNFSSGIYFYSIEAKGLNGEVFKASKKLTLMK